MADGKAIGAMVEKQKGTNGERRGVCRPGREGDREDEEAGERMKLLDAGSRCQDRLAGCSAIVMQLMSVVQPMQCYALCFISQRDSCWHLV